MSWSTCVRLCCVFACLSLVTLAGCKPKNQTPPPSGEAVTTEPLDIELPSGDANAAAQEAEAKEDASSAAAPDTGKPAEAEAAPPDAKP